MGNDWQVESPWIFFLTEFLEVGLFSFSFLGSPVSWVKPLLPSFVLKKEFSHLELWQRMTFQNMWVKCERQLCLSLTPLKSLGVSLWSSSLAPFPPALLTPWCSTSITNISVVFATAADGFPGEGALGRQSILQVLLEASALAWAGPEQGWWTPTLATIQLE